MSKDVDRCKVLKSIKVMKAVKKDGSWIHKANPGKKEQDKSRTGVAKDNGSSPVKKKSYVLSAVRKFETRVSAEEPEIAIANTAEENNGGCANICVEGHVQNGDSESVSLSKGNPEAREESKEEYPHTTVGGSNVDHTVASTIPDMMVSVGLYQSPTDSHAVPVYVAKSLPETPAANKATPGDEKVLQGPVEPVPLLVPKSPPQSALSAIMKDVEDEDESAAPTEEVSKTRSEEAAECEHNTNTEQSAESVPTNAEDYLERELNISDALESVNDLEAKAVRGKYSDRGIKLTDVCDVQPPTADTGPEPVEDPEQSELSEQAKMNQSDDAHITEMSQKPYELLRRRTSDVKAVCSFCERIIDGTTKLTLSEPAVICHPECLKCSVCAKTLGDLLTRMFLYHQGIHCDDCFANALVA